MARKQDKRAAWMAEYERELVRVHPELAGKIDWDTAAYFYLHLGGSPIAAAQKYLATHYPA